MNNITNTLIANNESISVELSPWRLKSCFLINGRKIKIPTSPLDLCLLFSQKYNLILSSYRYPPCKSCITATLSKRLTSQIESFDEILFVTFAINSSDLKSNHVQCDAEKEDYKIYLINNLPTLVALEEQLICIDDCL